MFSLQNKKFEENHVIEVKELEFGKLIGKGGFGAVYQGKWLYNEVAIKKLIYENEISNEAKEDFKAESEIMSQLRAPNIVNFFGYSVNPYSIVMEYMPKGSLYQVLRNEQPLEWSVRIRIASDIAKGLVFLHHQKILHRDIKSLNVLLDENNKAKLSDFGLAKIKNESKSYSEDAMGTIAWMAPELFSMKPVYSEKSDIYAMGITFWEIASRQTPFKDVPRHAIPILLSKGEKEKIPVDCLEDFSKIIQDCWAENPVQRPSAAEVVVRLNNIKVSEVFKVSQEVKENLELKEKLLEVQKKMQEMESQLKVQMDDIPQNKQPILFQQPKSPRFHPYSELNSSFQLMLNNKLEQADQEWNKRNDQEKHELLGSLDLAEQSYNFLTLKFKQKLSEGTQMQRHALVESSEKHLSTEEFWNINKQFHNDWLKKI